MCELCRVQAQFIYPLWTLCAYYILYILKIKLPICGLSQLVGFYSPQGRACAAGQCAAGQGAAWPATLPETREGPATAPVTTAPPSTAPERRAGPTAGPARAAGPATGPLRAAGPRTGPANAAPGARRPDGAASAIERAATRKTAAKVRMFEKGCLFEGLARFQAGGTVCLGGSGGCAVTWLARSRFYTGIVYTLLAAQCSRQPPKGGAQDTPNILWTRGRFPSRRLISIMRVGGDNGPPVPPEVARSNSDRCIRFSDCFFSFLSFSVSFSEIALPAVLRTTRLLRRAERSTRR